MSIPDGGQRVNRGVQTGGQTELLWFACAFATSMPNRQMGRYRYRYVFPGWGLPLIRLPCQRGPGQGASFRFGCLLGTLPGLSGAKILAQGSDIIRLRGAIHMDREKFEALVVEALQELPPEFLERLDNIDVVVEEWPTSDQKKHSRIRENHTLLGLYEGVPLTERSSQYGLVAPDIITIFQKPVEAKCPDAWCIKDEVRRVVQHEIAHHFGISDPRLDEIERRKGWK